MSLPFAFHLLILFLAAIVSGFRYRILSSADRYIALLIITTFLAEACAKLAAIYFGSNLLVYALFTPLQFLLISLYFSKILQHTRWGRVSLIAGWTGVGLAILTQLVTPPDQFNSVVIIVEGLCVVFFGKQTVEQVRRHHRTIIFRNPTFWVGMILASFWIVSVLWFGSYNIIRDMSMFHGIYLFFVWMNYVTYTGLATVFILYPKWKHIELR